MISFKGGKIKELFYVKGYARPVDYVIRVNVPFDYQALGPRIDSKSFTGKKQEWISTLNHELSHYFQFIGTAVGRRIVQLDQFIGAWKSRLIQQCPDEISIPLLKWMEEYKALSDRTDLQIITDRLSNYYLEYNTLCRPWDNTIFRTFLNSKSRNIDIRYFFREKPIKLDIQNSYFEFTTPTGEFFRGDISGYQIMESMAKLIQMELDGTFKGTHIIEECTNMLRLQYHFPMLFMLQEGITDNPYWEGLLYDCLMCICQISLMMNPRTLELYGDKKYKNLLNKLDPGKIFLEFLERGGEIFPHFLFNILIGKKNRLEVCDSICDMLKIPPYSYMLELAIEEAIEDKRVATDVEYSKKKSEIAYKRLKKAGIKCGEITLPFAESRGMQFDIGIHVMKKLQRNPEHIVNPLQILVDIPTPPIQLFDGQTTILRGQEKIWESTLPGGPGVFIINKILFDTNLSCYQSWDGNDIMFPCQYFEDCRNREKTDLLGFCKNEQWYEIVKNALAVFGIKQCHILE